MVRGIIGKAITLAAKQANERTIPPMKKHQS